jgi:hypothetical protein
MTFHSLAINFDDLLRRSSCDSVQCIEGACRVQYILYYGWLWISDRLV